MFFRSLSKLGVVLIVAGLMMTGCDQPTNIQDEKVQADSGTETLAENGDPIEGQYIVVFKSQDAKGKTIADRVKAVQKLRSGLLSDHDIRRKAVFNEYNIALQGFAGKLTAEQLEALHNDSRVDYIEQDRMIILAPPCGTPNGGSCDDDGGSSGQTTPWGITRVGGAVDGTGLNDAWIIDTGIDLDHPDLNVDIERSAVFVTSGPGSGSPDDGNGHGTHVAGTVAAIDNDIDVVGVAAGATVVAVKVLDNRGSGQYSWVINGVDYVAQHGSPGDVANMSLGGGPSVALDDAIRNAADRGIYFSLAAGNDGDDANSYSPARVEYNNVWTVSATDDTDMFASFSNWSGPTEPPIEYAAPGVSVLSTWRNGGTRTVSGTSMAAPHVAGVLLATGGNPGSDGTAINDPDGDPDPIVHN